MIRILYIKSYLSHLINMAWVDHGYNYWLKHNRVSSFAIGMALGSINGLNDEPVWPVSTGVWPQFRCLTSIQANGPPNASPLLLTKKLMVPLQWPVLSESVFTKIISHGPPDQIWFAYFLQFQFDVKRTIQTFDNNWPESWSSQLVKKKWISLSQEQKWASEMVDLQKKYIWELELRKRLPESVISAPNVEPEFIWKKFA